MEEITCATIRPDTLAEAQELDGTDVAVVEGAFGVAENGAVWIPQNVKHKALYFIAEALVIVLDRHSLVHNMQEAYEFLAGQTYPFGTFISGPSKTADIEQALVMGAHGACTCLVILKSNPRNGASASATCPYFHSLMEAYFSKGYSAFAPFIYPPSPFRHPVSVSVMRVHFLHSCGYEGLSQFRQRHACHRSGFQPPQPCEYLGQREQAYLLVRLSRTIVAAQHFPGRADAVESRVVQPQGVLFPVAEPVPFPVFQFRLQLGVDLRMVDTRAVDGMLHEHADEAAASRRVGKQFARVGRADEGGDARQGLAVPPVRLAQVEGGELHEVLQERVFLLGYAGRTRPGSAAPSR